MTEIESINDLRSLIGTEIGVSEWIEVTQERINVFAEATDDRQWIHTDEKRAREESPYGKTVAQGFLTLSMIGHLMSHATEL